MNIASAVHAKSEHDLKNMGLIERYEALEGLGMLADEARIGYPERPLETWNNDELNAVVKLFRTWPSTAEFSEILPKFQSHVAAQIVQALNAQPHASRKEKLTMASAAFSEAVREVLGYKDFPDIALVFEPGRSPGYFGGLRPDGALQICSRNLMMPHVPEMHSRGDMSFIELVLHESTHKLQDYMASKSDQVTLDEHTNQLCAQQFYEATQELRHLERDIYWQHPFERQARGVAAAICEDVQRALPELGRGR